MSVEKFRRNFEPQSESKPDAALADLIHRMEDVATDEDLGSSPRERLARQAERSIATHFDDSKEVFADYLAWLDFSDDLSPNELVREAAQRWYETVIGGFGARDVEARERAGTGEDFFALDERQIVGYTLADEKTIDLHVQPARTLSAVEKVRVIKTSFKELAHRMRSRSDLSEVEIINATSWIVAKSPRLMEKLGFTVSGPLGADQQPDDFVHRDKVAWRASITATDFLDRYGDSSLS